MSLVCPLCGDVAVSKHSQLMTHIRLMHADDPKTSSSQHFNLFMYLTPKHHILNTLQH